MGNKSQLDWNYKKNCTMILEINKHNESFALTNGAATWFAKPDLWFLAIFRSKQTFHIIKYLQNPFSSVALTFSTNRLEQQFKGNLFKKLPLNNHYIALRKSFKFYPSALFLVWYAPCTTWSPHCQCQQALYCSYHCSFHKTDDKSSSQHMGHPLGFRDILVEEEYSFLKIRF